MTSCPAWGLAAGTSCTSSPSLTVSCKLLSDHVPHPGRRLPRPRVDYTCRRPEGAHDAAAARSASPLFIPAGDNTSEEAKPECSYFVLNSSSGQVEEEPCVEWDFDNSTFSSTVGTEVIFDSDRLFQLACGWEYLRSTYQSIYMFGVTIGAPFNGVLADRYGRKMTVPWVFVAYSALAIGSCWIPNLSALLLSRFLMGAVHPTIQKTGYILGEGWRRREKAREKEQVEKEGEGMEVADPKWRTHIGIVLFLPWALGLMAWGGFAYLVREWRMLQLTVSLLCLAFLPTLWFMDESPRWLAVRGQHRRALRVLQRAARWNGVALPPEDELCSCSRTESRTRTPRLRTITLSLYTNYLLVGAVYFGLSLSGGDLSSDPFLYMVLTGVVELPAYTLVIPLVARYGRRAPVVAFFFLTAAALWCCPLCPQVGSMVLALIGKMSIASAFQVLDLYSSELFPTEVRTRGMSTAHVMSRVGSTCSPYIIDYLGPLYPWAPSAVFGAASVLAGLATLALPETLHVALPDTIEHLEEREIRTRRLAWLM
ncbi:putative organic cation transporter protein-like [Penaeus vannamei]|uniref:Putative organic cation transporter protein-like n=1 Tax=Penaeus vannamei TaxID=6689 RepID=A0A3R7N1P4_PENVA|nr:putative organic cation transporter protein-like [Penaeus vannamei]